MQKDSKKIIREVILAGLLPLLAANGLLAAGFDPGARAPDFELPDLNGKAVALSDILRRDKPVVLSFFGTWCDSCLKEMNDLAEITPKYHANVYLVGVDADKGKLERFAAKHKLPFPVLWDPKAKTIGRKYDLFRGAFIVVPKLFIISPAGTVEYVSESYDAGKKTALMNKLAEVNGKKWVKSAEIAVFFTGPTNGCLEPSVFRKQTSGGFIKLLTSLKQQFVKYPRHLLLDSGDFLPYSVSAAQAVPVIKAMELAGYDAIAPGDQDLYFSGFADLVGPSKLPLIASNLTWRGEKSRPAGKTDKTVRLGGIKFRIMSFTSPETFSLYPESFTDKLEFKKLQGILKDGKNADFLILLSHAVSEETKKIAEEFPQLDLIIGGHAQEALGKPIKAGNALIVHSGGNLERVGRILLRFDVNKKLTDHVYELMPLTNDIQNDPQIESLIKGHKTAAK